MILKNHKQSHIPSQKITKTDLLEPQVVVRVDIIPKLKVVNYMLIHLILILNKIILKLQDMNIADLI